MSTKEVAEVEVVEEEQLERDYDTPMTAEQLREEFDQGLEGYPVTPVAHKWLRREGLSHNQTLREILVQNALEFGRQLNKEEAEQTYAAAREQVDQDQLKSRPVTRGAYNWLQNQRISNKTKLLEILSGKALELGRQLTKEETEEVLEVSREQIHEEYMELLDIQPDDEALQKKESWTCGFPTGNGEECGARVTAETKNLVVKGEIRRYNRGPKEGQPIRLGVFSHLYNEEGIASKMVALCTSHQRKVREATDGEARMYTYKTAMNILEQQQRERRERQQAQNFTPNSGGPRPLTFGNGGGEGTRKRRDKRRRHKGRKGGLD